MRSFIAIPVADDTAKALAALQRRLAVGRPLPRDNLHLTLAFLDDQSEETLEALHEELQQIRCAPFALSLAGLGQYGRAVHLVVSDTPALTALHGSIGRAVSRAGISLPRRRFRPHVTIIRLKPGTRLRRLREDVAGFRYEDMPVDRFALYGSTLHPEGARHDCLADYPLASTARNETGES
ncbi:RNA 2',3'-cyclic phosphodiesterase [Ruegeria sediminis]|uniref:RNA 2',3'-cyclic phosphodiesterase n=1 Tax=Ruegeria sediminis TaxID=2583820 RepID=A0ABY2WX71_9RHOB|nr:RNA 2',3'-cyclic phosphodiesterase [Ruegeria sediminis]TMV06859.1 RNA 2',3'-cyclic phosphodiesterase [Ruegeria sediminis]